MTPLEWWTFAWLSGLTVEMAAGENTSGCVINPVHDLDYYETPQVKLISVRQSVN
jgi:hypothetical protein